jgi:hypothetical protein
MKSTTKPNLLFYIITIAFLLWNIIGVLFFIVEWTSPELVTELMTTDQKAMYYDRPFWYLINYGIATIAGVTACLLLLLKRRIAVVFAIISVVCVIISTGYNLTNGSWKILSTADRLTFFLVPLLSLALYFYIGLAQKKHWLR